MTSRSPAWAPNLIMPGVAKCGTTTLHDMLVMHPRITGGIEKEVRFLMDAGDPLAARQTLLSAGPDAWKDQYRDRGQGDFDVWLDASPEYQYQACARDTIAGLDPAPYLLWIFRRPSDRLYSLYQYARYEQHAIPHVGSFEQFIDEIRPSVSPHIAQRPMLANAWADTDYARTLEQWRGVVPEERVMIVLLEDLVAAPEAQLVRVAQWIGIDPAPFHGAGIPQSNPTTVTRNNAIRLLGGRAAKMLPDIAPIRRAKTMIRGWNSAQVDKSEKLRNAALLAALDTEFAYDRLELCR